MPVYIDGDYLQDNGLAPIQDENWLPISVTYWVEGDEGNSTWVESDL